MKKCFLTLFLLLILVPSMAIFTCPSALAYQPPAYIGNPETLECKYYFAGQSDCFDSCMEDCQGSGWNYTNCFDACADPCHYNVKPEGFTEDIGATTQFESQDDACNKWKSCVNMGSNWDSSTATCKGQTRTDSGYKNLFYASLAIIVIILILFFLNNKNLKNKIKELQKK